MEEGRRSLGSLGLVGEMASRKIGELSGGEKARVALAAFALIPYNCLLMDEPSNHLDGALSPNSLHFISSPHPTPPPQFP